jgi:hypothetical protein
LDQIEADFITTCPCNTRSDLETRKTDLPVTVSDMLRIPACTTDNASCTSNLCRAYDEIAMDALGKLDSHAAGNVVIEMLGGE